jgi:signal peptidase II
LTDNYRRALWAALALAVIAADYASKQAIIAAKNSLLASGGISISPFLNLVYAENTGAAFGLFAGGGARIFLILISLFAVAVVAVLLWRRARYTAEALSYSLLLGGALGNLRERILNGYVVDFVDVHWGKLHWPAFNVADAAIVCAALLLMATLFRAPRGL